MMKIFNSANKQTICRYHNRRHRKWNSLSKPLKQRKIINLTLSHIAYVYAKDYGDIPIVVSGGQGADEVIAEADVMKRYFISKGIDENRIIKEDRSGTPQKKFAFSKALIPYAGNIIYITSEYHCFRAGFYSRMAG